MKCKNSFKHLTGFLILFILIIFLNGFFKPSFARTVALVYDDSGSMRKTNRFVFANYASQILIGLLRDNDTFQAVTMSSPQTINTFGLENATSRKESIEHIYSRWQKPINNTPTPYQAVKTAMETILKSGRTSSSSTALDQKQDWLIITTDGNIDCQKMTRNDIIQNLQNFINDNSRLNNHTVRIIFILIGADAGKDFANMWQKAAPAYVERIFQVTPNMLAATMETVATLITGRDQKHLAVSCNGSSISFSSPFPLARITLFQQSTSKEHARILKVTNNQELPFRQDTFTIVSPSGLQHTIKAGAFKASVSHVSSKQGMILPAGTYTLTCNRNPDMTATKVFIDVAVDFTVALLDAKGTPLSGQSGILERCQGEKLTLKINFYNPLTRQPLTINDQTASQLTVSAIINQQTIPFHYNPKIHGFTPVTLSVQKGRQFLSCQARSPAYFNLKSRIFTIEGKVCQRPWQAKITPPSANIPYTGSNAPVPVANATGTLRFKFQGKNSSPHPINNCMLTATNLPTGTYLTVAQQTLSADNPTITIPAITDGASFPWSVSRSKQFISGQKTAVQLHFKTVDPTIQWASPSLPLTIKPTGRSIIIEAVDPTWDVPVTELGQNHPYGIRIMVNQQQLSDEEYPLWYFEAEPRKRLGCDIIPAVAADRTIDLVPRQYFIFPCFTQIGNQEIAFRVRGPFPGDQAEQLFALHIGKAPWWQRYFSFALTIILLLLLLWYLYGILKKPRFSRKSKIVVKIMVNDKQEGREKKHALASSPPKRYLVPYIPERKSVKGLVFIPGTNNGAVYVKSLSATQRERISIDGCPLSEDKRPVISLTPGNIMYVQAAGDQKYEIRYLNQI